MSKKYLSCAETAKLVRQALKEAFPGVKFSVRSDTYSGGASIRIGWVDGPNTKQIDEVTQVFCGSYFDGMIDYKGSITSMLDGEMVSFGADFIFTERKCSDELVARALQAIANKYGGVPDGFTVADYRNGKGWNVYPCGGDWSRNNSLESLINIDLSKRSTMLAQESATAKRAAPLYDDGYGASPYGGKNGERGLGYPQSQCA